MSKIQRFFLLNRSGHVGLRPVQVRDGLPQHRFPRVRGRSGQVLGVGGRHERTGSVARTAVVAFAVLCGTARVRGQVAGRRRRPPQRTAATARLVRSPGRAATATADVTAGALSVHYVATPAAAATAAAESQQQQLRDVSDGPGWHQVHRGRRRRWSHHPVVRYVGLSSSSPRAATAAATAPPSPRSRRLPTPAPARRYRQPTA